MSGVPSSQVLRFTHDRFDAESLPTHLGSNKFQRDSCHLVSWDFGGLSDDKLMSFLAISFGFWWKNMPCFVWICFFSGIVWILLYHGKNIAIHDHLGNFLKTFSPPSLSKIEVILDLWFVYNSDFCWSFLAWHFQKSPREFSLGMRNSSDPSGKMKVYLVIPEPQNVINLVLLHPWELTCPLKRCHFKRLGSEPGGQRDLAGRPS